MLLFDQIEIIIYLVGVDLCWYLIKVNGKFCQVVRVIAQGTLSSASNGDFLTKLLVKFPESCYIRAGCFDKVCFFFMIEMS